MSTIKEIGRNETTIYGARLAVCGNAEVMSGGEQDPTGNGWRDEAAEAFRAATGVITAAGFDYKEVREFRAYNGGPRKQLVEVDFFAAQIEVDEDGEERDGEYRAIWIEGPGATPVPEEIRAEVERVAAAAIDAMSSLMAKPRD